ncbi:MAG: sodium:solute symporter, partial [Rhodobacteraceae bacterium]|nr:sodium:solute symporter [Paracoccaceae bacterium]
MSLGPELVLLIGLGYVALLFGVAFLADWRIANGRWEWLNSPFVYTLSISIYCTSWTFYGAVGMAARGGLEFATIYLGPTLVFVGWWAFMRKLVRIAQSQGVTSIADFISARYGKSAPVAAVVTLIAVVSTLPYIALQLKAVASTFQLLISAQSGALSDDQAFNAPPVDEAMFRTAFWLAAGLALFGILFGTRTLDARERHHGLVAAIALEALVKLAALMAVGLFALFAVGDGSSLLFDSEKGREITAKYLEDPDVFGARWVGLTFLAGVAVICLPRQFHVTVVECVNEDHGRTAAWAFPLYLFAICLFVLPIMLVGMSRAPEHADPDLFVLTLPLAEDAQGLALLAFLGGFSSATSMVIVACIALSIMVSNHLIMPLADSGFRGATPEAGDVRRFLLGSRRVSICAILLLSFLYFRLSGEPEALASIGLISFVGVAQLLPSLVAAMYWPRATARGAVWGMSAGFACWLLLLFGPSLGESALFDGAAAAADLGSGDTLMTAMFWSLSINLLFLVVGSLSRSPTLLEQSQSAAFVDVFRGDAISGRRGVWVEPRSGGDTTEGQALYVLAQRILGADAALRLLEQERARQGLSRGMPVADSA